MKLRLPTSAVLLAAALAATPCRAAEAPFDAGLRRLAEVMGSLQFLAKLCGRADDWRGAMQGLLAAEAPEGERRARFIASFNRGYRAFADGYRQCTPSARAAMTLYVREGETLSRQLADRYGN